MHFFFNYKFLITCFWLCFAFNSIAQVNKVVNFKTITIEQNLTSTNVRNVIQDKNGFLWFATQDGLNKYDGVNIIQFTKNNKTSNRQILGADCYAMSYNKGESHIYVSNSFEGLNIIDVNTNTVVKKIPSSILFKTKEQANLKCLLQKSEFLIIASDNHLGLFNITKQELFFVKEISNAQNNSIQQIFLFKNNIGVVFLNGDIFFYNQELKEIKRQKLNNSISNRNVFGVAVHENYLWLATNNGLVIHNVDNLTENYNSKIFLNLPQYSNKLFTSSVTIYNNEIYFSNNTGTYIYNLSNYAYRKLQSFNKEKFEFLNSINSFLFTNNHLWLAGTSGVARIDNEEPFFTAKYKNESTNLKLENCFAIKTYNDNAYVGAEDALYKLNFKKNIIEKLLPDQFAYNFEKVDLNNLLVSTTNKLLVVNGKHIVRASTIFKELRPYEKELFASIEKQNEDIYLLNSLLGSGLYVWNIKKHTVEKLTSNTNPRLSNVLINNIVKIDENNAYLVEENAIEKINIRELKIQTLFTKAQLKNIQVDVFKDVCLQKNNLWIACYGLGLLKLNEAFKVDKVVSINEGINNSGTYKIFNIGDSLIAVTTNNGFSIYNIREDKVRNYFKEDGLQSNVFNELSGFQKGDSIYIGGLKGITIFDTKKYTTNITAPKLYFNCINIIAGKNSLDTTNLFLQYLQISNNTTQAKISFVGLNYNNAPRVQYWYRIKELNKDWISLGNQNFVDLIGLQPDTYTLEVKAANEDGIECAPIQLKLRWLPHWYQTLLFKIAVALAIAGLLYLLYSFRIRQLKKVLQVRKKISNDLHDDIGSTLSSINMYSQIAQLQPNNPAHTASIQENTKEVLEKLDDIVWATNPKNDQVKNFVERIDNFAKPLLRAKEVVFVFEYNEAIKENKISEATRQNLYLICKEAINNIAKYAQAKNCLVQLFIKNKIINCTIIDDGIGFDATQATERNGLLNMKLRAEQLKGKFTIISTLNKGTTIKVQLPL